MKKYCKPVDCVKSNEPRAVGVRIGRLLDALEAIHPRVCTGAIISDCDRLRERILNRLRGENWRVSIGTNDRWKVLPPK